MKYPLVLLLLTAFGLAEEPMKFRGAYVGQPLSDWAECSASGKAKSKLDGYKVHANCIKPGMGIVIHTRARGFMDPEPQGETFPFENQQLVEIHIFVKSDDWEKVKYDLTQKFGQPASETPQVYQNLFGARFEYGQGYWTSGTLVAIAKVKVDEHGSPLANMTGDHRPATRGIEVIVTDAHRAKLPSAMPSTLD